LKWRLFLRFSTLSSFGSDSKVLVSGELLYLLVKILENGVELKKLDSQGRIILPADWRETEVDESREVYIIKRKGYLKLVPKRQVDLTECFDKVDLGVKSIDKWSDFEKEIYEAEHP
jgi:bifunctional DNA-binding transcriptional regulator/antitoxin component of YhaV-PrlF toxin-antitoxin module